MAIPGAIARQREREREKERERERERVVGRKEETGSSGAVSRHILSFPVFFLSFLYTRVKTVADYRCSGQAKEREAVRPQRRPRGAWEKKGAKQNIKKVGDHQWQRQLKQLMAHGTTSNRTEEKRKNAERK